MSYAIKEIFDTLQGEGGRAGERSVFVRTAGCNLWSGLPAGRAHGKGACAQWCDTDFAVGQKYTIPEILNAVNELWPRNGAPRWVVLSGGEPGLQVDDVLMRAFAKDRILVAIETNGTIANAALLKASWLTVSPKLLATGQPSDLMFDTGSEMKVILPGAATGRGWTDEMLEGLRKSTFFKHYYVQPQDSIEPDLVDVTYLRKNTGGQLHEAVYKTHLHRCIDFVKRHPAWRLSIQGHKYVGVP